MKSPFTGGDAALCHEKQSFEFRKDNFEIVYHFYRCKDTNEEFTTTELDQLNMNQVYNLYRQKYAIPFPDEIKRVRELYGISALRMSKLLGFGDNQYRKYEEGETPSVSNGKMISALKDPHFFLEILKLAQNQFPNDEILKIEKRVKELLLNNSCFENKINEFIFHNHLSLRSSMNGYASVIPEKVKQIIVFFASALQGVFETKLNKLLFYSLGGNELTRENVRKTVPQGLFDEIIFGNTYNYSSSDIDYHINSKIDIILKDFTEDEIIDALSNRIVMVEDKVFLKELYEAEQIFAKKITMLSNNKKQIYTEEEVEKVLNKICKKENIVLEKEQKIAVIKTCIYDSGVFILSGSAGTGKTFITKIIVKTEKALKRQYKRKDELNIIGLAPTGKATKVMEKNFAELKIKCKTIHRALEYNGSGFTKDEISENCIILDESSMLDISLAKSLTFAIQEKSKIIFLGDIKQLPSIGAGNVLHDLIESHCLPVIELSVVKRQTAISGILKNAEHVINFENIETTSETDDFYIYENKNNTDIQKSVIKNMKELYKKGFYLEDIQLLIPQRTGEVGIYMFNYLIQQEFNYQSGLKLLKNTFEVNNIKYQLYISKNDKVIQTKNDYTKIMYRKENGKLVEDHEGITNGEIGIVERIYVNNDGEKIVEVKFDNYYAKYTTLSDLELAYAITIHKSQGSQWPATLIVVSNSHRYMLTNNLLYTAITRSMDYCGIICEKTAVDYAIKTQKDIHRNTNLIETLQTL